MNDVSTNPRVTPSGNQYLDKERAEKLWAHIQALERMDDQIAEVREDKAERKALAKADGFDTNILAGIIKRRKVGAGQTREADNLVELYEQALLELGVKPREEEGERE